MGPASSTPDPAVRRIVAALCAIAVTTGCSGDRSDELDTSSSAGSPTSTIEEAGVDVPLSDADGFLACVKERESGGDYTAVGPGAEAFGAYQLTQDAWDETAVHAGLTDLDGIRPNEAAPSDQDTMALSLLEWKGEEPWGGSCTWPPGTGPGSGGPGDTGNPDGTGDP